MKIEEQHQMTVTAVMFDDDDYRYLRLIVPTNGRVEWYRATPDGFEFVEGEQAAQRERVFISTLP